MPFSNKHLMYAAYGLFFLTAWFDEAIWAVIAAVGLYFYRQQFSEPLYQDHIVYLFRTLIGKIVLMILSLIVSVIGLGGIVYLASVIWFIFRTVYGVVKLHKDRRVTPTGWLV